MQVGERVGGSSGQYEVLGPLGSGGFGTTWRARRTSDAREVAIKQLRIDRMGDWKAFELFEREASVLRQLRHPRIPEYIDFFEFGGKYVLVQALVSGETLAARMRAGTRMDRAGMTRWFAEVLEVLEYLHGLSPPVIHRDVNPKNVIVGAGGEAWLIDFGTVQAALRSADSIASTSAGTFGYAPMEQFVGRALPQSDLYGLAMTFLAVQTGQEPEVLPFTGGRIDVRQALRGHEVDARVTLALDQMTNPDPAARPASAREVLDRIRPALARPVQTPAAAPVPATAIAAPVAGADFEDPPLTVDWEAARGDAEALGRDGAWGPAPRIDHDDIEFAAISDNGECVVFGTIHCLFAWHLPSQRVHVVSVDLETSRSAGISPDGRRIAVVERNEGLYGLWIVDLTANGDLQRRFVACPALEDMWHGSRVAVSPDGSTALVSRRDAREGDPILILDLATGAIEARLKAGLECDEESSLTYAPDGQAIALVDPDKGTRIFLADGREAQLEHRALAIGPDGLSVAFADEDTTWVDLAELVQLVPFTVKATRRVELRARLGQFDGRFRVKRLRFSPDGARLVVDVESLRRDEAHVDDTSWRRELVIIDVKTATCSHLLRPPRRGDLRLESAIGLGFGADGETLMVAATFPWAPYDDDRESALALYRLGAAGQVRPHAVLRVTEVEARRDEEKYVPFVSLAAGFHARIDRDGPIAGSLAPPYERPDLVRAGLRGEPTASSLTEREASALRDAALRGELFAALIRRGAMGVDGDWSPLMTATRGLTHLAPHLLQAAERRAAGRPRFGQDPAAAKARARASQLTALAEELGQRGADERAALFEQSGPAIAAIDDHLRAAVPRFVEPYRPPEPPKPALAPVLEQEPRAVPAAARIVVAPQRAPEVYRDKSTPALVVSLVIFFALMVGLFLVLML